MTRSQSILYSLLIGFEVAPHRLPVVKKTRAYSRLQRRRLLNCDKFQVA